MKRITSKLISIQVFILLCVLAFLSLILCYVAFGRNDNQELEVPQDIQHFVDDYLNEYIRKNQKHNSSIKNILMWTHNFTEPFVSLKLGRRHFVDAGCEFNNCYITNDKKYMDILEWDAILFHAPEYTKTGNSWNHPVPETRSPHTEYILACIESSANYPICENKWENYFNWTMTYKLDSEVPWEYVTVRDVHTNKIVGPGANVKWVENMNSVLEDVKKDLKNKNKAVAWIVSNCYTLSKREDYVSQLKTEMEKLNTTLDVYGKCGTLPCDKNTCKNKLKEEYMFYLSFENSFSYDYVTEKLLTAVQNNMVPIVWGGADYSRFLPPNSYINARDHSPQELAKLIFSLTKNLEAYSDFFRWKQHYRYYSIDDSYETFPLCKLCKALNNPSLTTSMVKENIMSWWNGEPKDKFC